MLTSKDSIPPVTHANIQGPSNGDMPPPPHDPVVIVNPPKKYQDAPFEGIDLMSTGDFPLPPPLSPSTSISSSQQVYESITSIPPRLFESTSDLHLYEQITPVPGLDSTLDHEGPGPSFSAWSTLEYQEVGKKRKRKKRSPARAILHAPSKMAKMMVKKVKMVTKLH